MVTHQMNAPSDAPAMNIFRGFSRWSSESRFSRSSMTSLIESTRLSIEGMKQWRPDE